MYIPPHFRITDESTIYDIMKENSFATLISEHNGIPFATHVPLILSNDHTFLYGHFARSNPQWKDINGQTVLSIFQGPHCYISPSWYETNRAVPTWNYITVHVYGEIDLLEDGPELKHSLEEMVLKYEGNESTYRIEDVDAEFLAGMNKGIQGFKIKINKLEGKAKLSQNHPIQRRELIVKALEQTKDANNQQIARLMKENLKKGSI